MGRDGSPNRPFADGDANLDRDNGGLGEPALPHCPRQSSDLRFPFERASSRHLPPGAATRHPKCHDDGAPVPAPEPEYPNQGPDGRDLRPEIVHAPANHPVSGFPLSGHHPATGHLEMNSTRAARGAAPTSRQLGRHAVPTLPRSRSRETPVRRHFTKLHLGRAKVTQPPTANRQPPSPMPSPASPH